MSDLNSLFVSEFCTVNEEFVEDEDCGGNEESQSRKYIIKPCGRWESIVAWGKNAKLDSEQEVAFQILASTYVLTFMEEAEEDCDEMSTTVFLERKRALELLACRRENLSGPIPFSLLGLLELANVALYPFRKAFVQFLGLTNAHSKNFI